MDPEVGFNKVHISRIAVLLPAPLEPINPVILPEGAEKEILLTANFSPNFLLTFFTLIMVVLQ